MTNYKQIKISGVNFVRIQQVFILPA